MRVCSRSQPPPALSELCRSRQEPLRVRCSGFAKGEVLDHLLPIADCEKENLGRNPERALYFRLNEDGEFVGLSLVKVHHKVAALQQGPGVSKSHAFQHGTQLGHLNNLVASDVDAADQAHVRGFHSLTVYQLAAASFAVV